MTPKTNTHKEESREFTNYMTQLGLTKGRIEIPKEEIEAMRQIIEEIIVEKKKENGKNQ